MSWDLWLGSSDTLVGRRCSKSALAGGISYWLEGVEHSIRASDRILRRFFEDSAHYVRFNGIWGIFATCSD